MILISDVGISKFVDQSLTEKDLNQSVCWHEIHEIENNLELKIHNTKIHNYESIFDFSTVINVALKSE